MSEPMPVVSYMVGDDTEVRFEVEPNDDWRNVTSGQNLGQIAAAVGPAIEGAKVVLAKVKEAGPDEIEVKFGLKVSGTMNWLIARAATEGNFEVTLTWKKLTAGAVEDERSSST